MDVALVTNIVSASAAVVAAGITAFLGWRQVRAEQRKRPAREAIVDVRPRLDRHILALSVEPGVSIAAVGISGIFRGMQEVDRGHDDETGEDRFSPRGPISRRFSFRPAVQRVYLATHGTKPGSIATFTVWPIANGLGRDPVKIKVEIM